MPTCSFQRWFNLCSLQSTLLLFQDLFWYFPIPGDSSNILNKWHSSVIFYIPFHSLRLVLLVFFENLLQEWFVQESLLVFCCQLTYIDPFEISEGSIHPVNLTNNSGLFMLQWCKVKIHHQHSICSFLYHIIYFYYVFFS